MSIFKDKVLLITVGTGRFGNAVLRRVLESDINESTREQIRRLVEKYRRILGD